MRGEFKGVTGKVTKVSLEKNGVAIEGIKKEKLKGGNVDVFIHTSNLLVTDLNTEDKWRQHKLGGTKTKPTKETKKEEAPKETQPQKEVKQETSEKPKTESKQKEEKQKETKPKPKENKESKTTKKPKKGGKQ
jgi:large subunit ribosomal protein L24